MKRFLERLGKERLYCDGGTGSFLQAQGLKGGEFPERWNLTHPDDIVALARSYFEAGSDIVNTNTFGANRIHFQDPEELKQIIEAAVRHARTGRTLAGREDGFVALDIGPSGRLLEPMGELAFEDAVELFGEVVRIGAAAGADLVLIETMSDTLEAKAAVIAAKENCDLPVCVTNVYNTSGKLLTGGNVESVVAMLEGLHVDALGLNCSLGPKQMLPIAKALAEAASIPVICNPNAGLPRVENGKTLYDLTADQFAESMRAIAECGVHVIGGCCGTTPEYIKKTIEVTRSLPFTEPVDKKRTLVTSYCSVVELGKEPVMIGEQINPANSEELKEALLDDDLDIVTDLAFEQEEDDAEILNVNVGLPEIDEPDMLRRAIAELQSVITLPLQIDATDAAALEQALRCYNGKPMVRCGADKQDSLDTVLALVAKYGGVVAVPLQDEDSRTEAGLVSDEGSRACADLSSDEEGIPENTSDRMEIASRIYEAAAAHGIPRKDIIINGLNMTISTDTASAQTKLEPLCKD